MDDGVENVLQMDTGTRTLMVGPAGSGKTTHLIELFKEFAEDNPKHKLFIAVVSPTAHLQERYLDWAKCAKKHKNKMIHYDDLNEAVVEEIKKRAVALKKKNQKKKQRVEFVLIIDDMGADHMVTAGRLDTPFTKLINCSRHYEIHMYLLVQQLKMSNTGFRTNITALYMWNVFAEQERELVRKYFLPTFSKEDFGKLCDMAFKGPHDYLYFFFAEPGKYPLILINGKEQIDPEYFNEKTLTNEK